MQILITAGNTQAPIDRVRVLTNVFTGQTGANLARTAWTRGHRVTILTSHPQLLEDLPQPSEDSDQRLSILPYQTFDELAGLMQSELRRVNYDVIFHAAAVSDYLSAGVYAPDAGTYFNARTRQWEAGGLYPSMVEQRGGKIKSHEPELWLRLVRAPKLVDRIRNPWQYQGILVKFKLEVGINDTDLLAIAEQSRQDSQADFIVANTLEGAKHYAYFGPLDDRYERISRRELAERVLLTIEHVHRGRNQ